MTDIKWFPSPAGSSYFSIKRLRVSNKTVVVSVPCGVFVFLNTILQKDVVFKSVSVPCGVFVFLNTFSPTNLRMRTVSVPCGVFVFLNI